VVLAYSRINSKAKKESSKEKGLSEVNSPCGRDKTLRKKNKCGCGVSVG
jgi:hypothetical protein